MGTKSNTFFSTVDYSPLTVRSSVSLTERLWYIYDQFSRESMGWNVHNQHNNVQFSRNLFCGDFLAFSTTRESCNSTKKLKNLHSVIFVGGGLNRFTCWWEDNTESWCGSSRDRLREWFQLALVRIQWRAHVRSAMNTVVPVDLGSTWSLRVAPVLLHVSAHHRC